MKWVPKIIYNGGATTLTLSEPQRFWEPEEGVGMGDEDVSAALIPESFWVNYGQAVGVVVRFLDSERVAFMQFIEWALKNKGTAFTFQFDKDDAGTQYSVYMETPKVGDRVRPKRDGGAPWMWELELVLRSSNGTRIHQALTLT